MKIPNFSTPRTLAMIAIAGMAMRLGMTRPMAFHRVFLTITSSRPDSAPGGRDPAAGLDSGAGPGRRDGVNAVAVAR